MAGRFDRHDPAGGHDTAGVPWAGRTLTGTGFDDDEGQADPALAVALADPGEDVGLVAAVAGARLLVPVVAVAGEVDESAGLVRDVSSDMAAVTLVAPDGQKALPAFTSLAALADWDPAARPVPVSAQRAALAAVQEGCQVIVLDVAGVSRALRPSMVWALAMGRPWVPAHEDEQVQAAVARAVAAEDRVAGHELSAGPHGALQITLTVRPGLDQQAVQALVTHLGEQVAADGEVRARIDAVSFRLRTA
jgi:hypothetical protein